MAQTHPTLRDRPHDKSRTFAPRCLDCSPRREWFTLSLWERAGVRGNKSRHGFGFPLRDARCSLSPRETARNTLSRIRHSRNCRTGRVLRRSRRFPEITMKFLFLSFLSVFFVYSQTMGQGSATNPVPQPTWGRIILPTNSTGIILLEVRTWPADGKLPLPTPFPNITAAHFLDGLKREPLQWIFNDDATRLHLEIPGQAPASLPAAIALETTEKSGQFSDGHIVFSVLDASVQGNKAKLESHTGNHRIGFWTDPADSVNWDFKPTRWGMYDLELAFSADDGDGTELQFDIAGQTFRVTRLSTGGWYRYQTLPIGRFYLARAEPFTLRVSCSALKGGAVMNLKAVTLRPATEGKPITQEESGALTLLARDVTTHSLM